MGRDWRRSCALCILLSLWASDARADEGLRIGLFATGGSLRWVIPEVGAMVCMWPTTHLAFDLELRKHIVGPLTFGGGVTWYWGDTVRIGVGAGYYRSETWNADFVGFIDLGVVRGGVAYLGDVFALSLDVGPGFGRECEGVYHDGDPDDGETMGCGSVVRFHWRLAVGFTLGG